MLVLERKQGEGLTLFTSTGEMIQVGVVNVSGNRVKLAIKAPEGVVIVRDELLQPAADHVTASTDANFLNYF